MSRVSCDVNRVHRLSLSIPASYWLTRVFSTFNWSTFPPVRSSLSCLQANPQNEPTTCGLKNYQAELVLLAAALVHATPT